MADFEQWRTDYINRMEYIWVKGNDRQGWVKVWSKLKDYYTKLKFEICLTDPYL